MPKKNDGKYKLTVEEAGENISPPAGYTFKAMVANDIREVIVMWQKLPKESSSG